MNAASRPDAPPPNCVTVREWDWRYRVSFDGELRERVAIAFNLHPCRTHRAVLLSQLKVFSGFCSVDALITACAAAPAVADSFICRAMEAEVLHAPTLVAEHMRTRALSLAP